MDAETRNVYLKCHTTTKGSFEDFRTLNKTNCGMESFQCCKYDTQTSDLLNGFTLINFCVHSERSFHAGH